MKTIQFYGTSYLPHQNWADNFNQTKNKDELTLYSGEIKESYVATNGDLIHFVKYEKGNILVQDKDKKNQDENKN
jgi:fructosamine-3-kinase